MYSSLRKEDGFTLLEMIVVVAIIAILTVLGIINYNYLIYRAKGIEAYMNLGNIYLAELSYQIENDNFRACNVCPRPDGDLDSHKVSWRYDNEDFSAIGFAPEGDVYFNYRVDPVLDIKSDFIATAKSDMNNDGRIGIYYIKQGIKDVVRENNEF